MDRRGERAGFKIKRNLVNFCPVFPRLSPLPLFLSLSVSANLAGYLPASSPPLPQKLNFFLTPTKIEKERKGTESYFSLEGGFAKRVSRLIDRNLFSLRESDD